ncbi:MAG: cell wall hydrolase [Novosphingobium sp.]
MRNPLLREITIMLLAALPLTLLVLLCQLGVPRLPADPVGAEIAALPGRSADAPLLAADTPSDMDAARAKNAATAFYAGQIDPARPFRFSGTPGDFANARDCLALAALAEAGGSDQGQRAVIQVVLNRVRHPAFARTVCGTVFEGSQRKTGCQFTFTCDGALARRYSDGAWIAAQLRAEQALRGRVFAAVGNATHYHTDWVHPSWSPKLVKLARVETHLFFRWPGYFGSDAAARMVYREWGAGFLRTGGRRDEGPRSGGCVHVGRRAARRYAQDRDRRSDAARCHRQGQFHRAGPHGQRGGSADFGPGAVQPTRYLPGLWLARCQRGSRSTAAVQTGACGAAVQLCTRSRGRRNRAL